MAELKEESSIPASPEEIERPHNVGEQKSEKEGSPKTLREAEARRQADDVALELGKGELIEPKHGLAGPDDNQAAPIAQKDKTLREIELASKPIKPNMPGRPVKEVLQSMKKGGHGHDVSNIAVAQRREKAA